MYNFLRKEISLKTKISTSLLIAIPLMIAVLVFGSGLFTYYVVQQFFTRLEFAEDIHQFEPIFPVLKLWIKVSVIAAVFLGLVLAYTITIPIKKLTLSTKHITKGDFTKNVQISSEDEVGMLGRSFNEMVRSLNEQIIESMTGGVVTVNLKGKIATFNSAAELILGYDSKDVIGKSYDIFSGDQQSNNEFIDLINAAIINKKTSSSQEIYIISKTGKKILIGITTSLLKDKKNTMLGIIVTFKDLRQIKYLEQQIRRADRLAAVGNLAAGVAHEIRNPLGSIRGLVQLLQEDLPREHPKHQYTEVVLREIDRLDKVVDDLLSFAKPETETKLSPETLEINKLIDTTLQLARHDCLNMKVNIDKKYGANLPKIKADPKQLQQAFLNIIFNAFHAMETGGTLTIMTQKLPQNNCLEIHFADTGIGMSDEIMSKLFDPFFTTRKGGTGLGLTITHQIISAHHGKIDLRSEPGKGTEVIISLPIEQNFLG
ncbi:MAG: ATP-binding protein [Candidatus Omnitrophota bacterium]